MATQLYKPGRHDKHVMKVYLNVSLKLKRKIIISEHHTARLDKYQNDAFACILLCLSFFLWVTLCMVQRCITCLLGLIKISGRKFVSYLKDKIYCNYDIGQLKKCVDLVPPLVL